MNATQSSFNDFIGLDGKLADKNRNPDSSRTRISL